MVEQGKNSTSTSCAWLSRTPITHATKAHHPQTNGICERFHKTMLDELYSWAFRKKVCITIEQLQADVDEWLRYYNQERPHSGRYCYGKTPMQTFSEARHFGRREDAGAPDALVGRDQGGNVSLYCRAFDRNV
jgi:Integrase core domain